MIPLNRKLRLLPDHSGLLRPLSQEASKGVTVLVEVIDYHKDNGLLFHDGGKEEHVWIRGVFIGFFFVLPSPVIRANEK